MSQFADPMQVIREALDVAGTAPAFERGQASSVEAMRKILLASAKQGNVDVAIAGYQQAFDSLRTKRRWWDMLTLAEDLKNESNDRMKAIGRTVAVEAEGELAKVVETTKAQVRAQAANLLGRPGGAAEIEVSDDAIRNGLKSRRPSITRMAEEAASSNRARLASADAAQAEVKAGKNTSLGRASRLRGVGGVAGGLAAGLLLSKMFGGKGDGAPSDGATQLPPILQAELMKAQIMADASRPDESQTLVNLARLLTIQKRIADLAGMAGPSPTVGLI